MKGTLENAPEKLQCAACNTVKGATSAAPAAVKPARKRSRASSSVPSYASDSQLAEASSARSASSSSIRGGGGGGGGAREKEKTLKELQAAGGCRAPNGMIFYIGSKVMAADDDDDWYVIGHVQCPSTPPQTHTFLVPAICATHNTVSKGRVFYPLQDLSLPPTLQSCCC